MQPPGSRTLRLVIGAATSGALIGIGVMLQYYRIPGRVLHWVRNPASETAADPLSVASASERDEILTDTLQGKRRIVIVAFGQSNAANHGDVKYIPRSMVVNFYAGKCYRAEDPLLGGTGDGGSVWTRLGDLLVEAKEFDTVVIASLGCSGATVERWRPGGDLYPQLVYTLKDLEAAGLPATHLLWMQGETDHSTSSERYIQCFGEMLKGAQQTAPRAAVFVSITSRTATLLRQDGLQAELVKRFDVKSGPDVDSLQGEYRNSRDKVHFSGRGLDRCAQMWFDVLSARR